MKTTNIYILLLVIFLSFSKAISAQNTKIDSLNIELNKYKEKDSIRVNLLIDLARMHVKNDFNKATGYLNEAEALSKSIGYQKGIAKSYYFKGHALIIKSNYNEGDDYFKEAIKIYKSINKLRSIAISYSNLGFFYNKKGDYNNSIIYYKKAVELKEEIGHKNIINDLFLIGRIYTKIGDFSNSVSFYKKVLILSEENNDIRNIGNCLTGIGTVYGHQGNYPLALDYLNKALALAKKNGWTKNVSDALVSIGNVYIRLQNYDKAIKFHEEALKETKVGSNYNLATITHNLGESYKYKKDYDTALKFFEEAIVGFEEKNNKADVAVTLNKIGDIYLDIKDNIIAHQYFEKAKKINISVDNQRGLCGSYLGLAKVYFNQKKYNTSLKNTLKSKEISTKLELIDLQRDVQQLLSEIYKNTGKYKKALGSHRQFKILNDSLFNKKNIEKITQLEYDYKYKQAIDSASIRELKLTKTVKTTSLNLEKSQRNYLWAIIGVLLVSILLVSVIFYQKFRNITSKNQNIIIEQKLLRSQMTPHFIFNSLSVLQGMILNKEEKKSVYYLSKFSKLLRITLENSRDKMVLLSQELKALQNYLTLQNLENEAYQYTILVEDTIDIPLFEIPPMLIQPFVENVIEHAFRNQKEDKKIDIRLTYLDKQLICTITDNGIGINAQKEPKRKDKNSLATTVTSERLKILSKDLKMDGSVTIEDRQKYNEKGTVVTLVIPHKIIAV